MLLAVGLEGFWGLVISAVALPALCFVKTGDGKPFDSFPAAVRVCVLLGMCSESTQDSIHLRSDNLLQEIAASRQLQWSTAGRASQNHD